ncbi:MAG: hypothetical protein EDM79_16560 [Chloroflexi bacterium]|nr:MAG: hypothetical protein EDM79_16560 [Chloroflexota bacterium]
MNTAKSINGITIRLPDERWVHITEEHAEMAGYLYDVLETVQEPLAVFEGNEGELLAAREIETGKYIIAVYREVSQEDGFIITAFLTKRWKSLERRKKIWQR